MIRRGSLEAPSSQLIQLANSQPNYGGIRRWFICPETGPDPLLQEGLRGAQTGRSSGVPQPQARREAGRHATLSGRTLRRLGSHDGRTGPEKPKWMHWSTYDLELTRAIEYSDASWGFSVVRVLSKA